MVSWFKTTYGKWLVLIGGLEGIVALLGSVPEAAGAEVPEPDPARILN